MTKNSITCSSFSSDDKVPRTILRAMEGAKGFLHSSLFKVPWLWRMDPAAIRSDENSDGPEDFRNYGKAVRSLINVCPLAHIPLISQLLRQIPSNRLHFSIPSNLTLRICVDCGEGSQPWDTTFGNERKRSRCICWANAALGVFLCSEYHSDDLAVV